ncbi:TPA: hypothetical protein ACH3X2_013709 [Trebouxia sp. C0005]
MQAAEVKMLAAHLQEHLDHDPQNDEPLDFDKDCVMVDGGYPYSKSGNPAAADIKQGIRAFLAGQINPIQYRSVFATRSNSGSLLLLCKTNQAFAKQDDLLVSSIASPTSVHQSGASVETFRNTA